MVYWFLQVEMRKAHAHTLFTQPGENTMKRKLDLKPLRAALAWTVVVGLLYLSLGHLVQGIQETTGAAWPEALAMAIGLDLTMVVCELYMLSGHPSRWNLGLLVAVCVLSATYNVLGFLKETSVVWLAWSLGILVPTIVYGLVQVVNGAQRTPRVARPRKARRRTATLRRIA